MSWLDKWNENYDLKFKVWATLTALNMISVIVSAERGMMGNAGFSLFFLVWCMIGTIVYYFKSKEKQK